MKTNNEQQLQRICIQVTGAVQGVGFRPFIFHLAKTLGLAGFVCNTSSGVMIEAEGPAGQLDSLLKRIPIEKPENSFIQGYQYRFLDPLGFNEFQIKESDPADLKTAVVLPDAATCPECLKEIFDPTNRRFLYPFTNCTHCGPRYSIIDALPYDRANTTMKRFHMCPKCRREYEDPSDRRFHAQPNACPQCGPHVELWDIAGHVMGSRREAITAAVNAIEEGKIVAVKGIGGFHLVVDAHNEQAVRRLRERKHREEKPFALMFPSMEWIERCCEVAPQERAILGASESPIVLLAKRKDADPSRAIAPSVAPGNPCLGAMLPYSPLHHLLMRELGKAVVATSGNLAEEPICINEDEALQRLGGIADCFLVHDRPIVRSIDDSVVRVIMERPYVLRRARGYAPLPVMTMTKGADILATGGHLKNTVALSVNGNVFMSQHIGDLETQQSLSAFQKTSESLKNLYESSPDTIVCDMHPDYLSTKFAENTKLPLMKVQHHHAHIVSCMAENQLEGTVLGIAWDGAGYGDDQTVWGGEFLKADLNDYRRVAHLKTFLLPGGDKAAVEPRRVAASILYDLSNGTFEGYSDLASIRAFSREELAVLKNMLDKKLNAPATSSVGRLFDAVASFLDIKQTLRFEGQAAMGLEYMIGDTVIHNHYDFAVPGNEALGYVADWTAMVHDIIQDVRDGKDKKIISAEFHNTLVEMAVDVARKIGEPRVVLSGGCFQNKYLTERMISRLKSAGFNVYWHQLVPPNDGGISLGQAVCAAHRIAEKEHSQVALL
ncbi:MAG: carbamoyltransferase HypF [Candidatus Omnitrophica bacterium]|nr:carbamoyltransferase HypF [Candidatus Omnitrophota bacterium]